MISLASLGDGLLLSSILLHLYLCPFTKVEESFNMQAMHDLLSLSSGALSLQHFDHFTFSGVVPRTFLGAILVTSLTYFPSQFLSSFGFPSLLDLYLCRGVLGLLVWYSFRKVRKGIGRQFGNRTAFFFMLLLSFQFHIPFYSTRTLPNTFALVLANLAFASWLQRQPVTALCLLGCSMTIFRCDILILLAPMALVMLLSREISFLYSLGTGIIVCLLALSTTVLVDSYFWNRWLWPEGIVLFFNTVENKSSEWGVSPWHWYFTSAIPRALQLALPLCFLGLSGLSSHRLFIPSSSSPPTSTLFYYLSPYLIFVSLYSFLPHKELRFIFPLFTPLTLSAAMGLHYLLPPPPSPQIKSSSNYLLSAFSRCLWFGLWALLIGMAVITSIFSVASIHNYPGGDALSTLHFHLSQSLPSNVQSSTCVPLHYSPSFATPSRFTYVKGLNQGERDKLFVQSSLQDTVCPHPTPSAPLSQDSCLSVHIDAASAIAGITRFQEIDFPNPSSYRLIYSKNESKDINYPEEYHWLIRGLSNDDARDDIVKNFDLVYVIYTFSGYALDWNQIKSLKFLSSHSKEFLTPLCEQHTQINSYSSQDNFKVLQRPLYASLPLPLKLKFGATHGIYRNKRSMSV